MNLLASVPAHCAEFFRPETLDERIVPQTRPPISDRKDRSILSKALEYLNILVDILLVVWMFRIAFRAAGPENPNYIAIQMSLSKGWMGPSVDNTDQQYGGFRSNFKVVVGLITAHLLLRRLLFLTTPQRRRYYDLATSVHVFGLHGTGGVKIIAILAINYLIGKRLKNRAASWVFLVSTLIANEYLGGYKFFPAIEYGGLLPDWQIFFKCTTLRMLSFNVDYLEAVTVDHGERKPVEREELKRCVTPREVEEYDFINYLGYCLYLPLYIGGPIITFNDFRAQQQKPTSGTSLKRVAIYALRFVFCVLVLEYMLHNIPAFAMIKVHAFEGISPAQISLVCFFALFIIWLKLLVPWRFFRLWALLDNVDPPENMIRCVANNFSTSSFWRSWHRSFNKWAVRYVYLPLGGVEHKVRNALITFLFTAMWHDLELHLFVWGMLMVGIVLLETVAKYVFASSRKGPYYWWRFVGGTGCVLNIWMMLIGNLVGFAVGIDGMKRILHQLLLTKEGLKFVLLASAVLFEGTRIMFRIRDDERERGVDLKC